MGVVGGGGGLSVSQTRLLETGFKPDSCLTLLSLCGVRPHSENASSD